MKHFEIDIPSGDRDTWLKQRCSGIGASEMPVLLGASEWESVLDVYARKVGEDPVVDDDESELIEWGRRLESAILDGLCCEKRANVRRRPLSGPTLLRSTTHRWAICTPDAMTFDGEPVEAKALTHGYHEDEWDISIPEKYVIQCHHQMLVTGAPRCLFGALLWGSRLLWEWVPRDETMIRRIVRAGDAFWCHVERREPPPSDGHANARKHLARRAVDSSSVELYHDAIDDALAAHQRAESRLAELRKAARETEKARDAAADAIAAAMGKHRSAFTASGWEFAWKRSERNGYTVEPKTVEKFVIKEPRG